MTLSESKKGRFNSVDKSLPMVLFPAPIGPTKKILMTNPLLAVN